MRKAMTIHDINPDGVRVIIDWDDMEVGMSLFIPCINTVKALEQIRPIIRRREWEIEVQVRIEADILGLRLWRTV